MSDIQVSQKVRSLIIFHQRDNFTQTVETDAVTWGQLKSRYKQELDFKNVRGVVKSTKNTLDHDDARLPEEDDLIYLFPKKVRSGMKTKQEWLKDHNSKQLRSECSKRGLGTTGTKDTFAELLADDDRNKAAKSHVTKKPIVEKAMVKKEPVTTEVAPVPANIGFATVEAATVTTKMTVRINDVSQLNNLLEVMFPGMEVISVDATVDLTAELKLGVMPTAVVGAKVEPVPKVTTRTSKIEKPIKKAPVKKEVKKMSKAEMKKEADSMAKIMNF